MNMKLKWGTAGRLRRGAVVLGVVGVAAGAAVMTAGSALAANGSQPGNLTLSPASGALTLQPTWSTSTACPAGNQGSAVVVEFNTDGSLASRVSNVVASPAAPITNATLQGTMGGLLGASNITPGGTVEWAVGCYSAAGGTGTVVYVQSTFVTEDAAGANYSTSGTGPVQTPTTTTVTAPSTANTGTAVTVSAGVTAGAAFPAGNIQFQVNGTNVGAAVPVNTGNVQLAASTQVTFSSTGTQTVQALFTPTSNTFAGSSGSAQVSVTTAGSITAGTEPITVNVPQTGTLTVTVAPGTVVLTPPTTATTPDNTATGTLQNVTVTDTRNFQPGWAVSGQQSAFTGSGTAAGGTISGNSLGWTPAFVGAAQGGAVIGSAVAPVGANTGSTGPGLGTTAAILAQAHAGHGLGVNVLSAALLLDIPPTVPAGPYAGSLTVTYVVSNP